MSDAPERIWAQDAEPSECDYTGGGWWDDECGHTQYPHMVEYVRADLSPQWHRIDDPDNPPPKDRTKILAFDGIGAFTVEWNGGYWMGSETDGDPLPSDDFPITHWMHLPPPPKGGE